MNTYPTEETRALSSFVDKFFVPEPEKPFSAWLLHNVQTGAGLALAVGNLRPSKRLKKGKIPIRLGAVKVDPKFQSPLFSHGPEALRWNGREIVVAVNTN